MRSRLNIYNYEKGIVTIYIFCGLFFNLNANVVTHTFCFKESDFVIDNIINVQYQCMLVNADLKLVLTRTSGVGLYQFDLNATQNDVSVDISSVPSGVYVVNLVENGTTLPSFSSRLVVE